VATEPGSDSYERSRREFSWQIPARFNLGSLCADRHPPGDLALVVVEEDDARSEHTFGELAASSNRLANALRRELDVGRGDRVGIVLPQGLETGLTHLALYKLGAVALPLSRLFGRDALRHRLGDSDARAVITDPEHVELVSSVVGADVAIVCSEDPVAGTVGFDDLLARGGERFEPAALGAEDPALLIYTSGTTGAAKGALHGQRVLFGHLPGFEFSHDLFPEPGDVFWTPADWAWIGGLMDALIPSWYHGRPVVATKRQRFDPEWAVRLIERERIRNVFFPPTVLRMMREVDARCAPGALRTIGSGGETLGEEILAWARDSLGVMVNEFYGQTEANLLVGNSASRWPVRPGSMGRPYPGHEVRVLDEHERVAPAGEVGQVSLRLPDPVAFLGYWQNPEETKRKLSADGNWLLTGDLAREDEQGYLWYVSREDDIINSAGYRVGPAEIESCLESHPAVLRAAVVGTPDPIRGEAVKAFVTVTPGTTASSELEGEIRDAVRTQVAAYLYPREIEFVAELPLTTTGKVKRSELRSRSAPSG
jgi:acetyl-CoA synthetase